jgi:hypothetical protein
VADGRLDSSRLAGKLLAAKAGRSHMRLITAIALPECTMLQCCLLVDNHPADEAGKTIAVRPDRSCK